jgi:multidrug resistance protein
VRAGQGSRPVLFLTVFIHLLGFGIIIPLLPYYAETYGAGGLTVGLLTSSFSLAQFLFAPLWGRLSDRVGRRPVLLASLLVTGVSYLVFAAATSLPVLFASRILAGIAGAAISTAQAYVADTTTPAERTKGMGLIGAAFGMGFIFGPATGGILSQWGFAVPAYAAAGLAFVAAIFAFFRLPESLPPGTRSEAITSRHAPIAFVHALRRPRIGPVLVTFFVATLCFAGMEAVLALFCEHRYGLGPTQLGLLLMYVGVVSAVMQLTLVGRLVRRFGERALVRAGLLCMALAFIACGAAPPLAVFLLSMGVVAVGSGLSTPSLSGLASLVTPVDEQGGVLGIYQSLGSLARAVGPFLGGMAYDHVGTGAPLWLSGSLLALVALYAGLLPGRGDLP